MAHDGDDRGDSTDDDMLDRLRRAKPVAPARPEAFWTEMAGRVKADYDAATRPRRLRRLVIGLTAPLALAAGLVLWLQLQPHVDPGRAPHLDPRDDVSLFSDDDDDLEAMDLLDDLDAAELETVFSEFKKGA